MANAEPILVIATHELRRHSLTIPAGTPGEITAMKGTDPTDYTVSFRLNGTGQRVIVEHVSRMDIHEA